MKTRRTFMLGASLLALCLAPVKAWPVLGGLYGAPVPAPRTISFGNLTPAGFGGVLVSSSSIASGDPSGHFQIVASILSLTSAGVGLSGAPYSLVLGNGQSVTVTKATNVWNIASQSDWDGAGGVALKSSATLEGTTILLRSGRQIASNMTGVFGTALRRVTCNALTIKSEDLATIQANAYPLQPWPGTGAGGAIGALSGLAGFTDSTISTAKNLVLQGIVYAASTATKIRINGSASFPCVNTTVDWCVLPGLAVDPNANFSQGLGNGANQYPNNNNAIVASGAFNTNMTITNNTLTYIERGCVLTPNGTIIVTGNVFDVFWDIPIEIAYGGADFPVNVSDNVMLRPCSLATDVGNPHQDMVFFDAVNTATTDWTVTCNRNRGFKGNARGDLGPIAFRDFISSGTDSGHFYVATAIGNVLVGGVFDGLDVEEAKNCVILANTIVNGPSVVVGTPIPVSIGFGSGHSASGTQRVQNNVAEVVNVGGSSTLTNNVALGKNGVTIPYATAFSAPGVPTTIAALMTQYILKTSGPLDIGPPGIGAIGSGAVNWATTIPGSDGSNNVS